MPARTLLFAALLAPLPAAAQIFQQGPVPARTHTSPDMAAQSGHGIESENLFGLTLGSDVDAAGSRAIAVELNGLIGARTGRYRALGAKTEFAYGATSNLSVSGSILAGWRTRANIPGQANLDTTASDGIGGEIRWRFLDRNTDPVGLTLHLEPSLRLADERSGERGSGWGSENRLILDRTVLPDRLFAAANLIYDIESFRPRGSPTERASVLGISTAASYQVHPGLFLGADIRYLRAYEGLAADRYRGWATFAGPTLFWHATDSLWISATYAFQIAGREQGVPQTYDLGNFPRQVFKLKIGMEF